jgi:hypothetical protein
MAKLDPADKVRAEGYDAMMRGDDSVVTGGKNKVMDTLGNVMPDTMIAKQSAKQHEPADVQQR